MSRPLEGLRVLDFGKVLAGPLCTLYLGEMGAEIIKVEAVGTGDETRGWPPFVGPGLGTVFLTVNRNKRSIALDLKTAQGREIAHRLTATADVAIESFGTGVAERLGIDADTLRGLNDRLVYCSISGFGRSGPMRNAPGYDVILQAFSGMMALTGEDGGGHIRSPVSPIDQMTGMHALTGILACLMERERTGRGGKVNVSLFDTAVGLLGYNIHSFWEKGVQPAKCGSSHEALCPYQAFEASDGPIMIGVANDNLWRKFCVVAGLEAIADDPRFRTNADRVTHRPETLRHVQEVIGRRPVAEWYETISAAGVPCSPINTLPQLLDHPHTAASGIVLEYEHPTAGALKGIAQPVVFNDEARQATLPPPNLGQHTAEILDGLGYGATDIERLRGEGVIA